MPIGSLVSDQPVATTPQYCQSTDVALILQIPTPTEAAEEGEPKKSQWDTLIQRMEEQVDRIVGRSWRIRRVLLEYRDWTTWISEDAYYLLQLDHRPIRTLDTAQGDVLNVWNGSTYDDWLAVGSGKTQARNGDFWLEEPSGYLRIRRTVIPWTDDARVQISYRYGESAVPPDIANATALLAAAQLGSRMRLIPAGPGATGQDAFAVRDMVRDWRREAYAILAQYQQVGRGY